MSHGKPLTTECAKMEVLMPNLLDEPRQIFGGLDESELEAAVDMRRLPRHIAIIMDGNGRWAQNRILPRVAGHQAGVHSVRDVTESAARLGIEALTLYAFSIENWKRPDTEIQALWRLLRQYLRQELRTLMDNDIRLNAFGRLDELPSLVRQALDETIAETASNTGMQLNLALNYGGRAEIVDAVNRLIADPVRRGPITEADIASELYTAGVPDPDLLIRTSGEMRVSNFLLWQIAYAELHVTETLWPDFRRPDLLRAILDYQRRERRFGGLAAVPAATTPAKRPVLVSAPAR